MAIMAASRVPYILEQVRHEMRRRDETDRRISYAWIVLPLIIPVTGFVTGVLTALDFTTNPFLFLLTAGSYYFVLLIASIVYAVLLYRLISRRNRHFSRQLRLFEYVVQLLREATRLKGVDAEAKLLSIERELREARGEEWRRTRCSGPSSRYSQGSQASTYTNSR